MILFAVCAGSQTRITIRLRYDEFLVGARSCSAVMSAAASRWPVEFYGADPTAVWG
jgi:hypothetical protein